MSMKSATGPNEDEMKKSPPDEKFAKVNLCCHETHIVRACRGIASIDLCLRVLVFLGYTLQHVLPVLFGPMERQVRTTCIMRLVLNGVQIFPAVAILIALYRRRTRGIIIYVVGKIVQLLLLGAGFVTLGIFIEQDYYNPSCESNHPCPMTRHFLALLSIMIVDFVFCFPALFMAFRVLRYMRHLLTGVKPVVQDARSTNLPDPTIQQTGSV